MTWLNSRPAGLRPHQSWFSLFIKLREMEPHQSSERRKSPSTLTSLWRRTAMATPVFNRRHAFRESAAPKNPGKQSIYRDDNSQEGRLSPGLFNSSPTARQQRGDLSQTGLTCALQNISKLLVCWLNKPTAYRRAHISLTQATTHFLHLCFI